MNLTVTKPAIQWFKKEMDAQPGDALRFFVRLGGCSTAQSGFSLGITKESPKEPALETTADSLFFYIEAEDVWYLDGQNLTVEVDEDTDAVHFQFSR